MLRRNNQRSNTKYDSTPDPNMPDENIKKKNNVTGIVCPTTEDQQKTNYHIFSIKRPQRLFQTWLHG